MIPFDRLCISTLSIDVASVSGNTSVEQTFTLNGLQLGDLILELVKPSVSAGLSIGGQRVSAANTLAITYVNSTASPINPAAETYTIVILRPGQNLVANAALFTSM